MGVNHEGKIGTITDVALSDDAFGLERAWHLPRNTMYGASANAELAGDFEDAFPGSQLSLDAPFNGLRAWMRWRIMLRSNSENAPVT